MKNVHIFSLFFILMLFSSCSQNGINLKKFINRLNHHEYTSSSGYIYEEDLPQLAFFTKQVMDKCPNAFVEIKDWQVKETSENVQYLEVKFRWVNCNTILRNYFAQINKPLDSDDCFYDNIKVVKTVGGDKLSFSWGLSNIDNSKLCVGSIANTDIKRMNIRKSPSMKSSIISKLESGDKIIIDNVQRNHTWAKTYVVDEEGFVQKGYVYNKYISQTSNVYFNPGIFDSMGIFVLFVIAAIILLPLLAIRSLFDYGLLGAAIALMLIVGCLYVFYQCIEKICFELLLINLPY